MADTSWHEVAVGLRFANRVPRPWVQELYPNDERPAPAGLLNSSDANLSTADIPVERYFSYDWHRSEVASVWKKTWQMACRVEELENVGDYVVYEIVDDSVIVVRTALDEIKAYTNSCLHRGTLLAAGSGCVERFRCPFHGWTYGLDGKVTFVPGQWDFSHLDIESLELPRVAVDTWAGFVFINLDDECGPLIDFLGVLWRTIKRAASGRSMRP